jgi:hypothetical protein
MPFYPDFTEGNRNFEELNNLPKITCVSKLFKES